MFAVLTQLATCAQVGLFGVCAGQNLQLQGMSVHAQVGINAAGVWEATQRFVSRTILLSALHGSTMHPALLLGITLTTHCPRQLPHLLEGHLLQDSQAPVADPQTPAASQQTCPTALQALPAALQALPAALQVQPQALVVTVAAPVCPSQAPVCPSQPLEHSQALAVVSQALVAFSQAPLVYSQALVAFSQAPVVYSQALVAAR